MPHFIWECVYSVSSVFVDVWVVGAVGGWWGPPFWLWGMVMKCGKHLHLNTTKQTGWPCSNPSCVHPSPSSTHHWGPYLCAVDIGPTPQRDSCCFPPLKPLTHISHPEQFSRYNTDILHPRGSTFVETFYLGIWFLRFVDGKGFYLSRLLL